jgi:hypothetical protein
LVFPPRLLTTDTPDLLFEDSVRLQVLFAHLHELLCVVFLLCVAFVACTREGRQEEVV